MIAETNTVTDLINYLNKYETDIKKENCSSEFDNLSQLLRSIRDAQNVAQTGRFPEASVFYHADRAIRFLDTLKIPQTASTTHRVFNKVIKKELNTDLGSDFKALEGTLEDIGEDMNEDMRSQATKYEEFAAISSYDRKFMKNSLLAALHCYRQAANGADSDDTARIERLLEALTTPTKLLYATHYLFSTLRNQSIPFSPAHPRFIEVLQDFCNTVNASPSDDTVTTCCDKWANELQRSLGVQDW